MPQPEIYVILTIPAQRARSLDADSLASFQPRCFIGLDWNDLPVDIRRSKSFGCFRTAKLRTLITRLMTNP